MKLKLFLLVHFFSLVETNNSKSGELIIWNMPINYYVDSNYNEFGWYVDNVMKKIENMSCIKFERVYSRITNSLGINFEYGNHIYSESYGPESNKKPNVIRMNFLYDSKKEAEIQSAIHVALGATPENNRCDREKYLDMKMDNIKNDYHNKFNINNYSCPFVQNVTYDYGSFTHFNPSYGTKNRNNHAFYSKEYPNFYKKTMGQRDHPTFMDYKLLNYMFCFSNCSGKPNICLYGGYLNPKNCSECICPSGLGGHNCSLAINVHSERMHIKVSKEPIHLTAESNLRNYVTFDQYNFYIYIFASNNSKKVLLQHIESKSCTFESGCFSGRGHEISYKSDKGVTGICLCNYNRETFNVLSEDKFMLIFYKGICNNHMIKFDYKMVDKDYKLKSNT